MNYAGIDVSKYKHDCFIISEFGDVIKEVFTFENNAAGFRKLEQELTLCGKENVRVGMESTGNYGINLKLFLERGGFEFMEINPLLVKEHIRANTLRRTTTDKLSAQAIADYMVTRGFRPHHSDFYNKFALKQLTRFRSRLVEIRTRYLICRALRLHNETFAAYYRKKVNEGKSEQVALSHMAKKLVRLIFALETKDEPFDSDKCR